MSLMRSATTLLFATGFLLGVPGAALAADNPETYYRSIQEEWGSADVAVTIYNNSVYVEASNVRSRFGQCVKLKYKVDRRTSWFVPFDAPEIQRDSVGELARTCNTNVVDSGAHDVTLNDDAWVNNVSFEFCEIRRFRSDDCVTVHFDPRVGEFVL